MKNMLIKKIIFLALAIFLLAQPLVVTAEIKFETNYPNLPGVRNLISAKGDKGLGMAVQYYIQWFLILAILACVITLVWAGVQYISSTGQPGVMREARGRIFNAFVGLAILTASYLILKTLNPQMSLLAIKKPSVPTGGIVLLSKTGFKQFNGDNFGDLTESGDIKPISGNIADLSTELGGVVKEIDYSTQGNPEPLEYNYTNFRLYAIGFWGETSMTYEVTLFKETQFLPIQGATPDLGKDPVKFTYDGSLMSNGTQALNTDTVNYFKGEELGLTDKIKVFIINGHIHGGGTVVGRNQAMWYPTDYPPKSIRIKNLKADAFTVDAKGNETLASGSSPDTFKVAKGLKILNTLTLPNGDVEKRDVLYIISDDTQNEGNKAVYFQYRTAQQLENVIPKFYFSNKFFIKQTGVIDYTYIDFDNLGNPDDVISDVVPDFVDANNTASIAKYPKSFKFTFFTKPEYDLTDFVTRIYGRKGVGEDTMVPLGRSLPEDFKYDGIYGNLLTPEDGKPSPLKDGAQFEIDSSAGVCREVSVCKKNGHCLKFVPAGETITTDSSYTHYLPMPFFRPVNLPKIKSWRINEAGIAESFEIDDFNDQVEKVETKGKCLVVLFERTIKFTSNNNNKIFERFGVFETGIQLTGDKSIIVPGTTNGSATVDLRGTKAMQCTTGGNRFVLWNQGKDPCASSIAVFPIK